MFNIGPEEIVLLLVIALVFLGPNRLPEVARQIGKGLREFRSLSARAQQELIENVGFNDLTDVQTDDETDIPFEMPVLEEPKDPSPNGEPKKKKKGSKKTPVSAGTDSAEAVEGVPAADGSSTPGSSTPGSSTEGSQITPVAGEAEGPESATIDAAPADAAPIGSDTGSTEVSG